MLNIKWWIVLADQSYFFRFQLGFFHDLEPCVYPYIWRDTLLHQAINIVILVPIKKISGLTNISYPYRFRLTVKTYVYKRKQIHS